MTGLPPGLRDPTGLVPPFLATPGDERDFVPLVPPELLGDPEPLGDPDPEDLDPVFVLVPDFVVPVPDGEVDEPRLPSAFDSSNLISLPTTKLFVSTKFFIHSGISPFFGFSAGLFCFGENFGLEESLALFADEDESCSVVVEGGVGVPGLKNLKKKTKTKRKCIKKLQEKTSPLKCLSQMSINLCRQK